MKDHRKEFKRIVEKLVKDNVLKRLECDSQEAIQKAWKKVLPQYKSLCISWKDKYYHFLDEEWIYSKDKKIKVNDNPVEICILIRLMNEADSRKITDNQVVKDETDLCEALEKTKNLSGILLAGFLEEDHETIATLPQEAFFEVFLR